MFWAELGAMFLGVAQNGCRCILGSQKLMLSVKLTAAASLLHSAKLTSCCKAYTALRGSYQATKPLVFPGPFFILSTYKCCSLRRVKVVRISLNVANCNTLCWKKDWNIFCTRFHVNALHVMYIHAICITCFEAIWGLFPVRLIYCIWFIVEL